MYQIIYIPRIQDEIVLGETKDLSEAKAFMEKILLEKPHVYKYHYIWNLAKMERVIIKPS